MNILTRVAPLTLVGSLLGGLAAQDDPAALAVTAMREALAGRDSKAAVAAVRQHGLTADADVVKILGKALSHSQAPVRLVAVQTLRWNTDSTALATLLRASGNSRLLGDDEAAAEYYLALGQRADVRALSVLTRNLHVERGSAVVRARILAIGRIRSLKAVKELMDLLKSGTGGNGRRGRGSNPHMRDLRIALVALTGHDAGKDETDWIRWWADNNDGYRLPEEVPELPRHLARTWDSLWKPPRTDKKKKGKKRPGKA